MRITIPDELAKQVGDNRVTGAIAQNSHFQASVVALMRQYAEASQDIIIRKVKVNRFVTHRDAINATGRAHGLVDEEAVATMPLAQNDEETIFFVKLGRKDQIFSHEEIEVICQEKLAKANYIFNGFMDPHSVAAYNQKDPAFADNHPNGTLWGNKCCAVFGQLVGRRKVRVARADDCWRGYWWLACRARQR
jgi:hypothetical protein